MILRKPSRSDYTKVKAYRSIALENIMSKIMENTIAKIISYLTEMHELLSTHHYEEHSDRNIKDVMTIISESIHQA